MPAARLAKWAEDSASAPTAVEFVDEGAAAEAATPVMRVLSAGGTIDEEGGGVPLDKGQDADFGTDFLKCGAFAGV